MTILERIDEILKTKPDEQQLDNFLKDVRDSLAASSKQFISLYLLVIITLTTFHLVVYEGASSVSFNTVKIPPMLFRRVFLVIPAALLCAASCIGYLRRWQREVYDYLAISRLRVLGKTGLHELRLPADYILGLFLLKNESGMLGKVVSYLIACLNIIISIIFPVYYIVIVSRDNIATFGDPLTLIASLAAILLCLCSLIVVYLGSRIKV